MINDKTLNARELQFIEEYPDVARKQRLFELFNMPGGAQNLADPHTIVKFNGATCEALNGPFGTKLNGIDFTAPQIDHTAEKINRTIKAAEPPVPTPNTEEQKEQSAGVIIIEPDNRIWLFSPRNFFSGYCFTLPKGQTLDKGETVRKGEQETAIKEAHEETGLNIKIIAHQGDYDRGNGRFCRVYIGQRIGGSPFAWKGTTGQPAGMLPDGRPEREETAAVWLVPGDKVMDLITLNIPKSRSGELKDNVDVPLFRDTLALMDIARHAGMDITRQAGPTLEDGFSALTAIAIRATGYASLRGPMIGNSLT